MAVTRSVRQTSHEYYRNNEDESIEEEIDNTNSSIIEVPKVSKSQQQASQAREGPYLISSEDEDDLGIAIKRRKANSKDDTISISSLSKRILSRSNSEVVIDHKAVYENNNDKSWVHKYSPSNVSDLAMHPKKLKEIESALRGMINGDSHVKILLLTGPAGSGKSTAVKILSDDILDKPKDEDSFLVINSPTIESSDDEYTENYNVYRSENIVEYINAISSSIDQFPNFLNDCKMLTGRNSKVVLVEDLPNVFHLETKLRFQKALQEWISIPHKLPPLVFCISENEFNDDFGNSEMSYNIQNNFVAETIIGASLLKNDNLQRIKVNPIAKTYLKKALTHIIASERELLSKIPKVAIDHKLENLCQTGDIRSSINCLEFWARYYLKFKQGEDDDFLSFGKESNLNLFNAIGKIIYGTSHEDNEIMNYRKSNNLETEEMDTSKIDQITIANVLGNYSNKSSFFNLNLLENYAMLNTSNFPICQELDNMIDNLSISDVLNTNGLYELGSNVAVRSTRYNMRSIDSKINNGSFNVDKGSSFNRYKNKKANFSRHYKYVRRVKAIESDIKSYQFWKFNRLTVMENINVADYGPIPTLLSNNDAMMIDGFFEASIINSRRNEAKIRSKLSKTQGLNYIPSSAIPRFPRLGGSLNNRLLSDAEIVFENDYDSFTKDFENYKTIEEKLLGVLTNEYEGEDYSEEEDEFDDDPIEDDEEVVVKPKPNKPSNEFIDDFDDDDSFGDEDW